LKKYWRACCFAWWRSLMSLWYYQRNDLNIPRKDPQRQSNGKIFDRYYHMFLTNELARHALRAWFSIEKLCYMGQNGEETNHRRLARNTIMVCKKSL
jgi:hypothetical protein